LAAVDRRNAPVDMFSAFDLFARRRSEWQLSTEAPPLIWQTGPDAAFWGNVVALVMITTLTVWAYATLASATRNARVGGIAREGEHHV
jgi:hypothetical protein